MTVENETYATGWQRCATCGVTQPTSNLIAMRTASLDGSETVTTYTCINVVRCDSYAAERELNRLAAKTKAAATRRKK